MQTYFSFEMDLMTSVYRSMWRVMVGCGPSQRKLKKFISYSIIMLVPDAVLSTLCTLALNMICIGIISICTARE